MSRATLTEVARRAGQGKHARPLSEKDARLMDAAEDVAADLLTTTGYLVDFVGAAVEEAELIDAAFNQLAAIEDPNFAANCEAFEKLDDALPAGAVHRAGFDRKLQNLGLSDIVLGHRMTAFRAAYVLGLVIGRRIGVQ